MVQCGEIPVSLHLQSFQLFTCPDAIIPPLILYFGRHFLYRNSQLKYRSSQESQHSLKGDTFPPFRLSCERFKDRWILGEEIG